MLKKGIFNTVLDEDLSENIDLTNLAPGIHASKNFFYKLDFKKQIEWVISRTCDHANGKLSLISCNQALCPLHDWQLDLNNLTYKNVQVKKNLVDFIKKDNLLIIPKVIKKLVLPEHVKTVFNKKIQIRFLSHATLAICVDEFILITDPWLVGPCFLTGWWHQFPPKEDALEILKKANLVYISHNHSDHLHQETLSLLFKHNPDINFIVPEYKSQSV
jgi:hypothetical protein